MLALANITNKKMYKSNPVLASSVDGQYGFVGYGVIVGLITEMSLISFWTQNTL